MQDITEKELIKKYSNKQNILKDGGKMLYNYNTKYIKYMVRGDELIPTFKTKHIHLMQLEPTKMYVVYEYPRINKGLKDDGDSLLLILDAYTQDILNICYLNIDNGRCRCTLTLTYVLKGYYRVIYDGAKNYHYKEVKNKRNALLEYTGNRQNAIRHNEQFFI